ncbi:TssA family type VI secretion system protein [Neisseriaceae bacterium ESL0693]|nr:TssA family type VI secretion system protein [Neisseriaceae bacterium ESL0693]
MQTKILWQTLKQHQLKKMAEPLWDEISPLLMPLAEPPEDIRYHESFLLIKAELEKASGIDLAVIDEAGADLCCHVAKDIRVGVYLTYVWLRTEAYQGLIKGLLFLYALCVLYPDSFQPRRVALIKTMLCWLSGDKVENALMLLQGRLLADEYQAIKALCSLIQAHLTTQFGQDFDELNALLLLLPTDEMHLNEADQAKTVSKPAAASDTDKSAAVVSQYAQEGQKSAVKAVLRSSQDVLDTMRTVARFISDQEQNEWASARLLRVFRWDLLRQLPPNEAGITRIMPPRGILLGQLDNLYLQQHWSELWRLCQQAFMEGANHFCLDLQYLSWCAMQHLGDEALLWADVLSSDVALLLLRLPKLDQLSFSDGRAFASEETRQWLELHARFREEDTQHPVAGQSDTALVTAEIEQQALAILHEQNMSKALDWLQGVVFDDDGLSLMRKHYLMAKLAIAAGQTDFALALLEKMNTTLSAEPLFSWDKKWTFQIKQMLWQLLKKQPKSQQNRPQLDLLVKEMTVLEPCLAHQLLYK